MSGEPDDVERLERLPLPDLATECVPADEDVLEDAHRAEEVDVLERPCDPAAHDPVRRSAQEVLAVELHRPGVGRVEPRDHVEDGRLARPVGPDQTGDRPFRDVERHGVERDDARRSAA